MKKIQSLSDEEVVQKVRSQDKELYAEIIRRYKDKLIRYALYLTQDEHIASDVVQDSFINAYVNLYGFNTQRKFSSWMYRIVHNRAMNVVKRERKKISLHNLNIKSDIDIEESIIKKELRKHTKHCLNKVPIMYREPLVLHYLEDRSYEEISDILRIPVGTVGTRIHRGKAIIKSICQHL